MIDGGIVDCMVALPGQLFFNTMIPVCLWILARDRTNHKFRDRSGEILFIDARSLGSMVSRRNKTLTDQDIAKIAGTYHAWRGEGDIYEDTPGFCKAATLDEVRQNGYVLMPGRYVGTEVAEDDGIPFEEKMTALTQQLADQFEQGEVLKQKIIANLKELGYEI
jgi:type I restriction enzyme M protein